MNRFERVAMREFRQYIRAAQYVAWFYGRYGRLPKEAQSGEA